MGRAHIRKNGAYLPYLFLFLAAAAIYLLGLFDAKRVYVVTGFVVCILSCVLLLSLPARIGRSIRKSLKKKFSDAAPEYIFQEDGFRLFTPLEESFIRYGAIEHIVETKRLFLLYVTRTAMHVVAKKDFADDDAVRFSAFIQKKVPRYKKYRSGNGTFKAILCALLVVIFLVGTPLGVRLLSPVAHLETVYAGVYSISLPTGFETQIADPFDLTAQSQDEVYVLVYHNTFANVQSYTGAANVSQYAQIIPQLIGGSVNHEYRTLDNGVVCVTYQNEAEDLKYFYCDAFADAGGCLWVTEFVCPSELRDVYEEAFITWSGTIRIAQ